MLQLIHSCLTFFLLFAALPVHATGTLAPQDLRVEYRTDPLGIDIVQPRHSWIVHSNQRGDMQTAYRIVAASSPQLLEADQPDLWDTGKVLSAQTTQVVYGGERLESRMQVFWKVRVWDREGRASPWSTTAQWSMGLLAFADWEADWIGLNLEPFEGNRYEDLHLPASPYLRTEFLARGGVRKAMLYASALGLFQMRLNGRRIGEDYFTPGWTDYHKRIYYFSYDVTEQIMDGANVLGAILADGWYAGYTGYALSLGDEVDRVRGFWGERPGLLAQLEIEYENGEREVVATHSERHRRGHPDKDDVWLARSGPILEADILMGESYDARKEIPGWDEPGLDVSDWLPVNWREPPAGRTMAYPGAPVRVQEELVPVSVRETEPGVYIYDLGKNFAGVVRLQVTGPAGIEITLRYGEMLNPDGSLMTANLRKARAMDSYVLKGDGVETWQPQFTYHGFQFVELRGHPGNPGLDTITGIRLNSNTEQVGEISIENDIDWGGSRGLVNQLFENIRTTQFANFFEVPTDCPQRDERLGWTGDAQIYARTSTYVADVATFFTKWIADLRDAQRWYGVYPTWAPAPFLRIYDYSPAWMDAGIIVPYHVYWAYGDIRLLEEHWDSATRFMWFQAGQAGDDFLHPGGGRDYGDWLAAGQPTEKAFIASAYYGYDALLMAEMAAALGKKGESVQYRALFERIRTAFADKYIDAAGRLSEDTQTAYAMTLAMQLYPEHLRQKGAQILADKVRERGNRLATGFLGTRHLLPVLSEFGHDDLAYALLTQTRYPSWGFEVVNGATSIWERWNSWSEKDGFLNAGMNSFSHYAFGAVGEWMFARMAGIEATSAGFTTLRIRPAIEAAPFDGVKASYRSVQGAIRTHWRKQAGDASLRVTIPANVSAEVYVPALSPASVSEGGRAIREAPGVEFLRMEQGHAVFAVGSGVYEFHSRDPWGGEQ